MTKPDTLERLRDRLDPRFAASSEWKSAIIACAEVLEERAAKIPWQGMAMPPKYHSLDVAKFELQEAAKDFRSVVETDRPRKEVI